MQTFKHAISTRCVRSHDLDNLVDRANFHVGVDLRYCCLCLNMFAQLIGTHLALATQRARYYRCCQVCVIATVNVYWFPRSLCFRGGCSTRSSRSQPPCRRRNRLLSDLHPSARTLHLHRCLGPRNLAAAVFARASALLGFLPDNQRPLHLTVLSISPVANLAQWRRLHCYRSSTVAWRASSAAVHRMVAGDRSRIRLHHHPNPMVDCSPLLHDPGVE